MKKLSVIIPTRDRIETLTTTIKSILNMRAVENFELIVSDSSAEKTASQTCLNFNDSRLRYIATPKPMTMAENYEFAIDRSHGTYILLLGDDDLIVENNLSDVLSKIEDQDLDLIYFYRGALFWGSALPETKKLRYFLTEGQDLFNVDLNLLTKYFKDFSIGYYQVPNVYNSIFAKRAIQEVRSEFGQKLFFGNVLSPDVFSGMLFLTALKKIAFYTSQVTVSGISISTGMSHGPGSEWDRFLSENPVWRAIFKSALDRDEIVEFQQGGILEWRPMVEQRYYLENQFYDHTQPGNLALSYVHRLRHLAKRGKIKIRGNLEQTIIESDSYDDFFYTKVVPQRPRNRIGEADSWVKTNEDFAKYLTSVGFNM